MNIDRFSPLLKRATLLLSLMAGSMILTGCGGGSDKKSSASSSSSSLSSARSSFVAASVPANGSGQWPSVKVEAKNPKVFTFQWSPVEGATYYKLFKHDAVTGGVSQIGGDLTATEATDEIGVHVHDWVNSYYYVEACNANGCEKSNLTFTATEMIKAIGYLKASNTEANDLFGWSIALSADGATLAVGAPAEDSKAIGANGDQSNNDSTNAGAVYVFIKENGVWVQQAYLKASNTEQPNINPYRMLANDRFGYKVALSDDGNTLAVSALLEDSPSAGINCNQDNYEITNNNNTSDPSDDLIRAYETNVGAVYVFTRTNAAWTQEAYVKPPTVRDTELRFGETLALSGDGKTLAVGTTIDESAFSGIRQFSSASSVFECFVYYPSSASSTSSTSSTSSSSSSSSSSSKAASSTYNGGSNSGAVHVFIRTSEGWLQEAYVKASNAQATDTFGASIALSADGSTMVVGATGEDGSGTGVNADQSKDGCYYFKDSNDLSDYAIEAECKEASKYQVRGVLNNGAAYIFKRTDSTWTQEAYLKPAAAFINTGFGSSVDISGDGTLVVVGATGDASNSTTINGDTTQSMAFANTGAAYVFVKSGANWQQEAFIKPSTLIRHAGIELINNGNGTGSIEFKDGGQFGNAVSLSKDGSTLAVGSFRESSNAKGINGDQGDTSADRAGAVFVFIRNNTVWTQQSYVKASNTDRDDRFGLNVDLSEDGKTMAVGAHRESGRGYSSAASSAASSLPAGMLDQNDNSAEASGAVYVY